MEMPGRKYTAQNYRYGFNGQEHDEEVFAGANTAEYWMYDARLGRRWENDPLVYEWQSPYATFNNNPIYFSDPLGLEGDSDGDSKTPVSNPKEGETHTTADGTVLVFKDGGWTFPDAQASTTGGHRSGSEGSKGPGTISLPNSENLQLKVKTPWPKMPSSSDIRKAVDEGMKNAMGSNMMLGFGRSNPRDYDSNPYLQAAYAKGQIAGDAISVMMATAEVQGGEIMAASCLVASPTGVALVGVGIGAAITTHGVTVISVATANAAKTTVILNSISYHDNNEEAGNSDNDVEGNSTFTSSKDSPKFAKDATWTKRNGKWGWLDKKGNFITKGDKSGEWHVHPNPNNKNPRWNGQKPRGNKQPYWNVNNDGNITH